MEEPLAGDERARQVWPLAAAAGVVAMALAVPALDNPPAWLARAAGLVSGRPLAPAHSVVAALATLLVARGILLRRRAAWYGLVVLVASGMVAVLTGEDPAWRLPFLALALAALWRMRDEFPVRPHPDRVRTALKTGAGVVLGSAVVAIVAGGVSFRSAGPEVASGLGAMGEPIHGASWLPAMLALVGAAGLLMLVITLLEPHPAPPPGDAAERGHVAGLVAHPASGTLAPFALRLDKSYVLSPDGRAAIGYRVLFGVAVAGGDPVGDSRSYDDAIAAFLEMCGQSGWRPAALGAGADLLPAWERRGRLRSFGFGDEVLVRPREFGLAGRHMRNVRQAVQRTRNAGVTVQIAAEADLPDDLRERLLRIASRSLGGTAERGFSMNLDELLTGRHPGALVAVASGPDGDPVAFQRYATAGQGISLDAMRRAPGGPNGVNERLIVEMIEYAREHGIGTVSLNFAAFRELLDSDPARRELWERAGYRALHLLDPLIAVESLYLFDRKFRPSYKPRCIVFRSWLDIAWLAAALLTLEFGRPGTAAHASRTRSSRLRLGRAHSTGHAERP